ncbi:Alpha/Beta hydrolase protein [Syncephalis fuscata]|nr:Alpha/Beta hydrolase protein [Syncephalis fuscata]
MSSSSAPVVDPAPEEFNHCFATLNGVKHHYIDEGSANATPLILFHGFPDLWYGWRHQIKFLKSHGYRVIVPSARGYNQTDPGTKLEDFSLRKVGSDGMDLLTHLGIQRAIVLGHDWGGAVAWRVVKHHPERVMAVASVCTPYMPPSSEFVDLEGIVKKLPNFHYQLYLNDEKCIAELDAEPERFLRTLYRRWNESGGGFKAWWDKKELPPATLMSEEALQYYVDNFRQSGFRGPTSWYRTQRINYDEDRGLDLPIAHPSLMVNIAAKVVEY